MLALEMSDTDISHQVLHLPLLVGRHDGSFAHECDFCSGAKSVTTEVEASACHRRLMATMSHRNNTGSIDSRDMDKKNCQAW